MTSSLSPAGGEEEGGQASCKHQGHGDGHGRSSQKEEGGKGGGEEGEEGVVSRADVKRGNYVW